MDLNASTSAQGQSEEAYSPKPSTPMPPKKRVKRHSRRTVTQDNQSICHLIRIPLEILAEVLSYTTPRDILALARCSKYFCHTLVNPSCDFIWKKARLRYSPAPVPDPTPNFTEASYASFIFDYGMCEFCEQKTKAMYASFTLRLRLCTRPTCRNNWRTEKAVECLPIDIPRYRSVAERLPSVEYRNFGYASAGATDAARPSVLTFRQTQWSSAIDEFNKIVANDSLDKYKSGQTDAVQRCQKIMEHGMELVNWRTLHDEESRRVQNDNLVSAKSTAREARWPLWDLLQTSTYGLLYHSKNKSLEMIAKQDFDSIRHLVEAEIVVIVESRQRREAENAYRERRTDVAQFYATLKDKGECGDVLPTLSEFRKLPVVQVMQNKNTAKADSGISKDFKRNKLINELVKQDLSRWQDSTRAAFAALLGFPRWKKINSKTLHPTERVTARFRCKRCEVKGRGRLDCRSMNFTEACDHHCPGLTKKQRAKDAWKVDYFYADEQAINVLNQLLDCCGAEADDVDSLKVVQEVGTRILCLSCPSTIVMNYEMMLSHCSRHDEMHITLVPQAEVEAFIKHPVEHGLLAQLTASPKALREKRVYGCRHCVQASTVGVPAEAAGAPPAALSATEHVLQRPTPADSSNEAKEKTRGSQPKAGQGKRMKMFTFDGLRSHAKEKHGVLWIGDEDFYKELTDSNIGASATANTT